MIRYLMKCGHATTEKDTEGNYFCDECNCKSIERKIISVTDGLVGRKAINKRGKIVISRWDLPGFIYFPDREFDSFFSKEKLRRDW